MTGCHFYRVDVHTLKQHESFSFVQTVKMMYLTTSLFPTFERVDVHLYLTKREILNFSYYSKIIPVTKVHCVMPDQTVCYSTKLMGGGGRGGGVSHFTATL